MPRPDTVTPEDINRWRREIRQHLLTETDWAVRQVLETALSDSVFADRIIYSGAWLGERLREIGCPEELCGRIRFAHGQRVFGKADPWDLAKKALDYFQQGEWDEPGLDLAERVIAQTLPALLPERVATGCASTPRKEAVHAE